MTTETRTCQNCKRAFVIEPDDFAFYEQVRVPPPTWCPECRLVRRLASWGYRHLYKRKCDMSGKDVITVYHPDVPQKVYASDIWYSDRWDPLSYGKAYDFNRPFLEQFKQLSDAVPRPALYVEHSSMIDSDYCNAASSLKNCYLAFKADRAENSGYLNAISFIKDSFDISYANYCELSYGSVNINKCYGAFWSIDCDECQNVWFSRDLVGCSNCIGCINLRNKQYCILNEQFTKEEYEKTFRELDLGSAWNVESFRRKAEGFMHTQPRKQFHGRHTVNVSGDYLYQCKNVRDSYWVHTAEDVRYSQLLQAPGSRKAYDYSAFGFNSEWICDSSWIGINASNVKFSFWNYTVHEMEYCFGCHGSGNMFGCVGVRQEEYCILNKQYTKEEYLELLPRIKKHMDDMPYKDAQGREYRYGEHFPTAFFPWTYNESHLYEFQPLTKNEALAQGFRWRDPDVREYQEATVQVPDHIKDVKDDIVKGILKCVDCGKNYRLIPMELQFYKRSNIPIPKQCPLCRHYDRVRQLNPMEIFERHCAKCNTSVQTSYAPDRPEIVYCESCYNAEVA